MISSSPLIFISFSSGLAPFFDLDIIGILQFNPDIIYFKCKLVKPKFSEVPQASFLRIV